MYDYREEIKNDIMDYIEENVTLGDFSDREELENKLNDDLWTVDSVTGNASGSYTFNSYKAREYVSENMEILSDMANDFCVSSEEIGKHFINEDWEWFDVSIRCYLLNECIAPALDELGIDDDTFIEEAEETEEAAADC